MNDRVQGSLFEQDYLVRTLGSLATIPDVALTELVANAWDAGATKVEITLPDKPNGLITVEDDGCGLTIDQFRERWMRLGYDRQKRQGRFAEFPPERADWRRRAYGRNGIGRHGMLCFADQYAVETSRDGAGTRFKVAAVAGGEPFALLSEEPIEPWEHGTRLLVDATRNVPQAGRIREVLAGRFLHDPQFTVFVNGETVRLSDHEGFVERVGLQPNEGVALDVLVIDSTKTARRVWHHGVAYWVGGRLVGEPSWILGNRAVADGRTKLAKRHTVIVRTDDLFDQVEADWSGFRRTELMASVHEAVANYVESLMQRLMSERVGETRMSVLYTHRQDIRELRPLARLEIGEFVEEVTSRQPTIQPDLLAAAVEAVISLEKSRGGVALLQKLSALDAEDVESLNRLLDEWTVRDALTVLDEIDRRIAVTEALARLSGERTTDELHTLHPLVTQARWLFGPQYDSPLYSSNTTLRKAMLEVFKKRVTSDTFLNQRKRPDLIVLGDATVSAVATEDVEENGLCLMRDVLIIELKRGASTVGRDEIGQAEGYVEDLINSGLLDGAPFVKAFVVGDAIAQKTNTIRKIGADPEVGRVEACTFGQLVRTANARLFRLREQLQERYAEKDLSKLLGLEPSEATQLDALEQEPDVA